MWTDGVCIPTASTKMSDRAPTDAGSTSSATFRASAPIQLGSCANWRLAAVAYATQRVPIKRLIAASIEGPEVIHGHFEQELAVR